MDSYERISNLNIMVYNITTYTDQRRSNLIFAVMNNIKLDECGRLDSIPLLSWNTLRMRQLLCIYYSYTCKHLFSKSRRYLYYHYSFSMEANQSYRYLFVNLKKFHHYGLICNRKSFSILSLHLYFSACTR